MKSLITLSALIFSFFLFSAFTSSDAQLRSWTKLGSKTVSYKLDKDVIHVGPNDGSFTKLKIAVTGGNINIHKMIVEYGNGTKDAIPIKQNFKKRSDSRVIDLEGKKRVIKDITFWYDTKNRSKNRGTVHVFGKR